MALLYCVPTSAPCLFNVVGSCVAKNTSNNLPKEIIRKSVPGSGKYDIYY